MINYDKSYYAKYHAIKGTLIGGVTKSQTSRFDSRKDAQLRLEQILTVNQDNCVGKIVASTQYPEIFLHCGSYPTAIGCKCPGCGIKITVLHAQAANLRD